MKKFPPFLIALFAGIAQGFSLAPANQWLQLAALAVLFFIFAGLRTVKAGFLPAFSSASAGLPLLLRGSMSLFMTTATSRQFLPPSLSSFFLATWLFIPRLSAHSALGL